MNASTSDSAATRGGQTSLPPLAVRLYVAAVVAIAAAVALDRLSGDAPGSLERIAMWALFAGASQVLVFPTVTRAGEVTLGTGVHLAMMMLLESSEFLPALWLSRLVVNGLFQKKPWYRALFNAAQVSLAVSLASAAYHALGGEHVVNLSGPALARLGPAFLGGATVYYVVNMASVSGVLALTRGESMWRAWRANYGYAAEVLGTVGLAALAPIIAICETQLGAWGLVLFLIPMVFVRDASRRYVELRRTQEALVGAERLAAKGELAAQIGHEINNYLTIMEHEMMRLRRGESSEAERSRSLEVAAEQTGRIRVLTRGLLDFNQRTSTPTPTVLGDLFRRTSDWVSHQRSLDGIAIHHRIDSALGTLNVDPGQMQQLLMNLLLNAAHAMNEAGSPRREIQVWVDRNELARVVEIGVADTGPGIPADVLPRIFSPGFTTRAEGHGYGLAAAQAIVHAHRGRIRASQRAGGGAQFLISLPFDAVGIAPDPDGTAVVQRERGIPGTGRLETNASVQV